MINNQIFINETSLCNQPQCSLFQFSTSSIFFDSDVKAIQDSRLHIIHAAQLLTVPLAHHLATSTKHNDIFDSATLAPLRENMTSSTKL